MDVAIMRSARVREICRQRDIIKYARARGETRGGSVEKRGCELFLNARETVGKMRREENAEVAFYIFIYCKSIGFGMRDRRMRAFGYKDFT